MKSNEYGETPKSNSLYLFEDSNWEVVGTPLIFSRRGDGGEVLKCTMLENVMVLICSLSQIWR